jgi:S-DNA-T family DNA segregation ATPase FtsK/SpoIIIE
MPAKISTLLRKKSAKAKPKSSKTTQPHKKAAAAPSKPAASARSKLASAKSAPRKSTPGKSTPTKPEASRSSAGSRRARRSTPWLEKLFRRRPPLPVISEMSLDRKLDIIGIFLTLLGLLTVLSMLSANQSKLTGAWVSGLSAFFGLGMYLFAASLILTGLWLVLRNFEHVPQVSIIRIIGIGLLFINLEALLHYLLMLSAGEQAFDLAQQGRGGGYLGALTAGSLQWALGVGGAGIALAAWLLIALGLTFDITIVEMGRRIGPFFGRIQDWLIDSLEEFQARRSGVAQEDFRALPGAAPGQLLQPAGVPAEDPAALQNPIFHPNVPGHAERHHVWLLPPIERILDKGAQGLVDDGIDQARARLIEETLASFGAPARVIEINRGPTITQFGVEPDFIESRSGRMRVRVGKITALADDLALALSARTIRIQAPVPGKGFVGLEVPNEEVSLVALRDLIENEAFKRLKSPLRFALGLNVSGNAVAADLAAMPHLLIAGATGSGKSVCVNSLICCLLMNNTPDDLRLIMVDPKRVELTGYNGIPHLLAPVVVELEKVVTALQWVMREMDMRYRKLAEAGCRNVQEYNNLQLTRGQSKLPYLVVIIDELADLMMLAPDETERTITRLAQLARATGIHLVIATQRPSVDVVTGLIKANFPARVAFAVASGVDSRVILDQPGAERLLGRGDMLFQAPDAPAPSRLQGVFVSDSEIQRLVSYWQEFLGLVQPAPTAAGGIPDAATSSIPYKQMPMWEEMKKKEQGDPLLNEATDLARRQGRASISMLQRRLRIGYTRAARLIDTLEEKGIVGPPDPMTGAREILDYGPAAPPADDS